MKITKRQLKRIIKEAIDVVDDESGELIEFGDMEDAAAPEAALDNILKRLNVKPKRSETSGLADGGVEKSMYFSAEDFADIYHETEGKRHIRGRKKERARMNIDNLLAKVDQWATGAGGDYGADNPEVDMQDVAWDLASGAKYQFAEDEWDELIWHFDNSEDELITYIADNIA